MFKVNKERCIACGLCSMVCSYSTGNIEITNEGPSFKTEECFRCGQCMAICPNAVIENEGFGAKSDIDEISKDYGEVDEKKLFELMKRRRSVRIFSKKRVPRELIRQVIDCGRFCASSGNSQSLRYIVLDEKLPIIRSYIVKQFGRIIQDEEKALELFDGNVSYLEKWKDICKSSNLTENEGIDRFTFGAQSIVIIVGSDNYLVDSGLVSQSMDLMANTLGLGLCYIGFFRTAYKVLPELKHMIGIERDEEILNAFAIGYPALKYHRTTPHAPLDLTWY